MNTSPGMLPESDSECVGKLEVVSRAGTNRIQLCPNWFQTAANSRAGVRVWPWLTQPQAKQTRVGDCFGIDLIYTKAIPNSCLFCLWTQHTGVVPVIRTILKYIWTFRQQDYVCVCVFLIHFHTENWTKCRTEVESCHTIHAHCVCGSLR